MKAYQDGGGVWTCGIGETGPDIGPDTEWTQLEADERFARRLRAVAVQLRGYLYRAPSQQQFDALCSLAFNCGASAIGSSGLVARFNHGLCSGTRTTARRLLG